MQENNPDIAGITRRIKNALHDEGFDLFAIVPATEYQEDREHLTSWLAEGRNGSMRFMEKDTRKRTSVPALFEGAATIIIAGLRYYSNVTVNGDDNYIVARYAHVRDYHVVMKEKLRRVAGLVRREVPGSLNRAFCDSAPLTEKTWAIRAGLGWRGRNSLVINKDIGSFFFLGEIVTTAVLEYDSILAEDRCGTCFKCVEACPTGAICDDRTIDARKCIAYLTIEHDGPMPEEARGKTGNLIFGCDICQEACPWNRNILPYTDPELVPECSPGELTKGAWQTMTGEEFRKFFRSSPVSRTGYDNIKRNIRFADGNSPE